MTHLKAAVDKQRSFLIAKLIKAGVVEPTDYRIYNQSIAELTHEYEKSVLEKRQHFI